MEGSGSDLTAAQRIRQQTREATRRVLMEAGLAETLSRGGLDAPSIDAICARAGYTRGAFYVHFRDRDHFEAEVFEWVLNDILGMLWRGAFEGAEDIHEVVGRFSAAMTARIWPDLDDNIRAGYLSVLRAAMSGPEAKERHARLMKEVVGRLAESVRDGQSKGTLRKDLDPDQAGMIVLLLAIAMIMWDDIAIEMDVNAIGTTVVHLLETPPRPTSDLSGRKGLGPQLPSDPPGTTSAPPR